MTALNHVAQSYARALFDIAKSTNSSEEWSAILANLAALTQPKSMQYLLNHPNFSSAMLRKLLMHHIAQCYQQPVSNLLALLKKYKRLAILPSIHQAFLQLKLASENKVAVTVESAFELTKTQIARLERQLSEQHKKQAVLAIKHCPALIGGIKIVIKNEVWDQSILGLLNHIKASFKNKEHPCS
ncbi:MAG: F0F1 ATP synthase subunit delta [Neisseriales bacterium]|nr:MAG: F0F1 ATP synthase subunit delta [Neisseriales bacterium]